MLAVLTLLVAITMSILVTRVATIALIHTGLSRESARFQARSAFTGSGFTTSESERVVNHPVRRRIVMLLMLLGNAGFVTVISSLILTFVGTGGTPAPDEGWWQGESIEKAAWLVLGLAVLWAFSTSKWVDRRLSALIDRALRRGTHFDTRDYASLMHLVGDYRLVELRVRKDDWLADKTLAQLELRDEGVIVLGIKRPNGHYLGAPNGDSRIEAGDSLLLYGRQRSIDKLDRRRESMTAELRHDLAVEEQRRRRAEEAEEAEVEEGDGEEPRDFG